MDRRSAAETRALLIETGVAMLHERGVTAGVTHIRLKDVVKQAGLTTGAAYRLWSDQSAFHHDLALAATAWRDDRPLTRTLSAIRDLVDGGAPLREVIRSAAAAQVEGLAGRDDCEGGPSPSFVTALALRAAAAYDDELRAAGQARHRDSVESFNDLYGALLRLYGRQMRSPFTLHHLAVAFAALGEGFALQAIEGETHPVITVGEGDDAVEWTVFGVAVDGLVEAMTMPVPEVSPRVTARDG